MESEIAQIHKTCSMMEKAVLEAYFEKDVLEEQHIKAAATRLAFRAGGRRTQRDRSALRALKEQGSDALHRGSRRYDLRRRRDGL